MMDFVAIDFETATRWPDSACSVALVDVRDGAVADSYYTLICPPGCRFDATNSRIHGITSEMVAGERDFAGVWPELQARLAGRVVIAHNASFDMNVLRHSLRRYHLAAPAFRQCCTVQIARRAWPELPNHKLNTVGDFLHVDFAHHNALEDARACAMIPLAAARECGAASLEELTGKLNVTIKPFV
ncbi:MAG: 3'-5' exonuclease [Schwartzia sp.]|nr:3'-5' exonuclease [Schwartzia sp. (in: firmicutes)]